MYYIAYRGAGGAPNNPIHDKIDKNNDIHDIWDGLRDLKCAPKKIFHIITRFLAHFTCVLWSKMAVWVHFYHMYDLW